jgi:hypothetical protein
VHKNGLIVIAITCGLAFVAYTYITGSWVEFHDPNVSTPTILRWLWW